LGQILGILAPLLLAAGIVIYGTLGLGYDQFYSRLGIDPAAVGLNYGTVLSHATGFVAGVLIALAIAALYLIRSWRKRSRSWNNAFVISGILCAFLFSGLYLFIASRSSADAVASGRPVAPIASPLGFTLLAVHADPVRIEATGKVGEVTAIDRLVGERISYTWARATGS
jgi:drug/metabolite transporter (DMT)-like permease